MQEHVKHSGIFTVDALYLEPELASIHLLRDRDSIAIIDTGTLFSVPQVAAALDQLGLNFSHVKLIILTHIHLDHAGGAGSLMNLCENAQLAVHPKGARHMAEPEKLVAGAISVYGEEKFANVYGQITPIDSARIITPQEGDEISLGNRQFLFIDTPGHASHHHCILDRDTNSMFTGDTLGIAYQALRDPEHAFVMPTTTPVQFNPVTLHQSIDKVMSYKPEWLYYTHYSSLQPSAQNIAGLHEQIEDYVMLTQQVAETSLDDSENAGQVFEQKLGDELFRYLVQRARNELTKVSHETIEHWVTLDAGLNAQGLAFWWKYRR